MKKVFSVFMLLFVIYTVGFGAWILFMILKMFGKLKVINQKKIPKLEPGIMIICSHKDIWNCMLEIWLLPGIFFPQVCWHPIKLAPCFTPDKHNFTDKWYWFWLRPLAVPAQRDKKTGDREGAKKLLDIAASKQRTMMLFPEGGRTCTGKNFTYSNNGTKKIRTLKDSLGGLVLRTHAPVALVWMEEKIDAPDEPGKKLFSRPTLKRGPIIIKFGKTLQFQEELLTMNKSCLTDLIAKEFLELAEE